MKFKKWLRNYGGARLSRELNLHENTIYGWTNIGIMPRADAIAYILEMAQGEINIADIVNEVTSVRRRKNAKRK